MAEIRFCMAEAHGHGGRGFPPSAKAFRVNYDIKFTINSIFRVYLATLQREILKATYCNAVLHSIQSVNICMKLTLLTPC